MDQNYETATTSRTTPTITQSVEKIPHLVSKEDVTHMINLQMSAIDRLEATNKSLHSCNTLAKDKLSSTMKLFKRTAKQMNESKKDLDIIYKKVIELKSKLRAERPDLFASEQRHTDEEQPREQSRSGDEERTLQDTRPHKRSSEIAITKLERQ